MIGHVQRGDLSLAIGNVMTAAGLTNGRGLPPAGAGWIGVPNTTGAVYQAYTIFIPGAATIASGSFVDAQMDWQMPYILISYGISAEQCESQADAARKAVIGMNHQHLRLGLENWQVYNTLTRNLGQVVRNDNFTPPEFSQQDVVLIWISKELS